MIIKANIMIDYMKYLKKQSKNKERIDNIREDLRYKISKSELKEIKTELYNIEKRKKIITKKKLINI